MGDSYADLEKDGALTREIFDVALRSVDMGFPGSIPHIDTVVEKSGIAEYKRAHHEHNRIMLWSFDKPAAFLNDFSYLHSAKVHRGRERLSSGMWYMHHVIDAEGNYLDATKFPEDRADIRYHANVCMGLKCHDDSEERVTDEVKRRLKTGETVTEEDKVSLRREMLDKGHKAYMTAIDALAFKLGLDAEQKQQLVEMEIDRFINEDKMSRGRVRYKEPKDTYDQYVEKALWGSTQINNSVSDVRHELMVGAQKCYESGQNGDTLFPHLDALVAKSPEIPKKMKRSLADITRIYYSGGFRWDDRRRIYEPNVLGKQRRMLESLQEAARLEGQIDGPGWASAAFGAMRKKFLKDEKQYKQLINDQLSDYVHIIPAHSRADTIQWNAYIANKTLRSARTSKTNRERERLSTPWLREAAQQAGLDLAERTYMHATMQMDNEIVYNGFSLDKAKKIQREAEEYFQHYEQSFRITSEEQTRRLPEHLQPYDRFTNWLYLTASGDPQATKEFRKNTELQYRQMAVARSLCSRLLKSNFDVPPESIRYVRGSLET